MVPEYIHNYDGKLHNLSRVVGGGEIIKGRELLSNNIPKRNPHLIQLEISVHYSLENSIKSVVEQHRWNLSSTSPNDQNRVIVTHRMDPLASLSQIELLICSQLPIQECSSTNKSMKIQVIRLLEFNFKIFTHIFHSLTFYDIP